MGLELLFEMIPPWIVYIPFLGLLAILFVRFRRPTRWRTLSSTTKGLLTGYAVVGLPIWCGTFLLDVVNTYIFNNEPIQNSVYMCCTPVFGSLGLLLGVMIGYDSFGKSKDLVDE